MKGTKMKNMTMLKERVEESVRCNINHSGNRKLTFDVGYWQCNGCTFSHATKTVEETLVGKVGLLLEVVGWFE